jgi:enamine deaminase RidA (YjgF/YER057c/UK114 family)
MQKTRKNYEDIYPAGPTYIRGVRAGETLYISGVTALNSEAKGGPPMAQLRVVLDRITRIVAA